MRLTHLEIAGFKSFGKKSVFEFSAPISGVVGPNGSGKSNVVESIRFVTGEQSMKSLRGKRGEDLIFNGSKTAPRASSGRVTIVFDNRKRELDVDFDEVQIAREVSHDGSNAYYINGTQVRLRDIYELLSAANIGASSHHIISQGEADRILNASPKERKEMIEDALGLKIYQWKIAESEKKLEKTRENIKEAESLRREIAPHIRYLKKQVEKIEEGRALRHELRERYLEYLKREEFYVAHVKDALVVEKAAPAEELRSLSERLSVLENEMSEGDKPGEDPEQETIRAAQKEVEDIRAQKGDLTRALGRVDGMLEYKKGEGQEGKKNESGALVPVGEMESLFEYVHEQLVLAENEEHVSGVRSIVIAIRSAIKGFTERVLGEAHKEADDRQQSEHQAEIESLMSERTELSRKLAELEDRETACASREAQARKHISEREVSVRESERELYALRARRTELESKVHNIDSRMAGLEREERDFQEEFTEALVLAGESVREYAIFRIDVEQALVEPRSEQEARRKYIERLKIKIEDIGGGSGEEVMKEYEQTTERDQYLARELEDLTRSAESLSALIVELTEKINKEFKQGIVKINTQFQEFFALMFDGGTASLAIVQAEKRRRKMISEVGSEIGIPEDDEPEVEEGVEVRISLPHKKIRGLVMLSGGERALTSIALLFAISQVNPPPFLVLDETDAALDESNSRKYGDMLETLSRYSQLIVVTHNRETMSRAGVLYGVTMGSDAVSRVLSVKFDEAAAMAK